MRYYARVGREDELRAQGPAAGAASESSSEAHRRRSETGTGQPPLLNGSDGMASIYKRGKNWWVHYYVNGKSVDRSLRTTNERVARDRKKKLEAADVVG